jgi:hypothetical protein
LLRSIAWAVRLNGHRTAYKKQREPAVSASRTNSNNFAFGTQGPLPAIPIPIPPSVNQDGVIYARTWSTHFHSRPAVDMILQSTLFGLVLLVGVSAAAPTSSTLAIDTPVLVPRKGCPYVNEQRCQQVTQDMCAHECDDFADGVINSGCVVSCLGEAAINCEKLCR